MARLNGQIGVVELKLELKLWIAHRALFGWKFNQSRTFKMRGSIFPSSTNSIDQSAFSIGRPADNRFTQFSFNISLT